MTIHPRRRFRALTRRTGRGVPGWTVVGGLLALAVAGPLIALPLSYLVSGESLDQIAATLLPEALGRTILLGAAVGAGTLVVGGALAVLVSFYDFPGRQWLEWALVLPLAMPGYVLVFVLLGQYGVANPLQSNLFGQGLQLPWLRGPIGAIVVLTAVLYPYVYILGRSAFLGQSRHAIEAARSLGSSYGAAIRRVAVPLARPALAAGVALAVMETIADFGVVNLLGYETLSTAIYRVWFGAFDEVAALQLATVLVSLALTLLALERFLRGRARYERQLAKGDALEPFRLRGWKAALAPALPGLLLLVVFVLPCVQLVVWSIESVLDGTAGTEVLGAALLTVMLAVVAALVAVVTSVVVTYGNRARPSRFGRASARVATVGYAVPGTVIAVAIFSPLVWLDRRAFDVGERIGFDLGLVFTGTVLGLIVAYVIRFHALAYFALDSRMGQIGSNLDDAARALGADRSRLLAQVHVPLLWPGILTAALLVFVEVMKELPATALLRPLGADTLAITVWESTKDSQFDVAALPALLIVAVGLAPVVLLVRYSRRSGWGAAAP